MRNIFKDTTLQKNFENKGYVEIPLLDAADILQLNNVYLQHKEQYGQPFHTSHFSNEIDYKRQVNDTITKVVFPKLEPFLENYKPIFGNLMIKHGMNDYFMPLHSDWTYVNEDEFRSIAAWISLVDTDEKNGCLGVIEGSHKVISKIRGPRIQLSGYVHDKEWVKKFGKLLPVKAGHAIIFDHALMHYSPANNTSQTRPALNLSMVPADAGVMHYCIPEGSSEIEMYRVDNSEFFLNYSNFQKPGTNSLIRTLPANTVALVDEKMEKFTPFKKKNLLERIFG